MISREKNPRRFIATMIELGCEVVVGDITIPAYAEPDQDRLSRAARGIGWDLPPEVEMQARVILKRAARRMLEERATKRVEPASGDRT